MTDLNFFILLLSFTGIILHVNYSYLPLLNYTCFMFSCSKSSITIPRLTCQHAVFVTWNLESVRAHGWSYCFCRYGMYTSLWFVWHVLLRYGWVNVAIFMTMWLNLRLIFISIRLFTTICETAVDNECYLPLPHMVRWWAAGLRPGE